MVCSLQVSLQSVRSDQILADIAFDMFISIGGHVTSSKVKERMRKKSKIALSYYI